MKIPALVFVLSLLLPLVNSCFNNPQFSYFYAGMYRNCQNIRIENLRREEMCSRFQPVWENCPQSCGLCCLNDPDYRFRTRKNSPKDKTCEWMAEQSDETKARLCRKWSSGRMIRDACPLSCDFCQPAVLQKPPSPAPFSLSRPPTPSPTKAPTTSPTAAPTKSPTKAPTKPPTKSPTIRPTRPPRSGMPTPSPTAAPTKSPTKSPSKPPTAMPTYSSSAPTYVCLNDENYFAASNPQATCFWIGEDERRRQNFCTNEETVIACPHTCGICCRDDRRYSFQTYINTTKRCGWVRAERIRQNRYCEERRNGRLVKSACPVACDFCFDPIGQ